MTTGRWLRLKRWKAGRRSADEHYKAFLETSPPTPSTPFKNAELVCLDIETTGLDPATVDMLSIGWVLIRDGKVDLSTAESHVVKPSGGLGNSPSIHGLTDSVVDQGMSPEEAMARVVEVLTGRILVVHHAGLDKKLLDRFAASHVTTISKTPARCGCPISARTTTCPGTVDTTAWETPLPRPNC
jgi:DNA polymerase-3 subunit epsilon